jgi:hypothetical protein
MKYLIIIKIHLKNMINLINFSKLKSVLKGNQYPCQDHLHKLNIQKLNFSLKFHKISI